MSADRNDYLERLTEASLEGSPLPEPEDELQAQTRRDFEETEALWRDFDVPLDDADAWIGDVWARIDAHEATASPPTSTRAEPMGGGHVIDARARFQSRAAILWIAAAAAVILVIFATLPGPAEDPVTSSTSQEQAASGAVDPMARADSPKKSENAVSPELKKGRSLNEVERRSADKLALDPRPQATPTDLNREAEDPTSEDADDDLAQLDAPTEAGPRRRKNLALRARPRAEGKEAEDSTGRFELEKPEEAADFGGKDNSGGDGFAQQERDPEPATVQGMTGMGHGGGAPALASPDKDESDRNLGGGSAIAGLDTEGGGGEDLLADLPSGTPIELRLEGARDLPSQVAVDVVLVIDASLGDPDEITRAFASVDPTGWRDVGVSPDVRLGWILHDGERPQHIQPLGELAPRVAKSVPEKSDIAPDSPPTDARLPPSTRAPHALMLALLDHLERAAWREGDALRLIVLIGATPPEGQDFAPVALRLATLGARLVIIPASETTAAAQQRFDALAQQTGGRLLVAEVATSETASEQSGHGDGDGDGDGDGLKGGEQQAPGGGEKGGYHRVLVTPRGGAAALLEAIVLEELEGLTP